jgi:hypothetical protein
MFSQRAIQEFKEAFGIMDADRVSGLSVPSKNQPPYVLSYPVNEAK